MPALLGCRRLLGLVSGAVAQGHQKNRALACGVGREKAGYFVVEERQAGSAEVLGVGREIQLAAEDAGFELHSAISPIAVALQDGSQIGQEEDVYSGFGRERLLQPQVAGLGTKVSLLQTLKRFAAAVKDVSAGLQTFHGMDDQVEVVELRAYRIEKVRRHA